ncbi:FIST N-terminal domain-containing protein [Nocardia sp. NBC_01009]|uniref:FIST signal transduction protein n=1 Tax=Nocardia sp. NBC_01009 TaxID=2975996 RepID=UPI003864E902|nr:FIST C-terminal domain-containing protein [Nocardia sp. NBC_01009]
MRIGVGLSTAPEAWQAGAEAAAHALDQLAGETLSLAVLLTSRTYTDEASAVLAGVHQTVQVPALIGCVAQGVVAGRREIEDEPSVVVWLASGLPAAAETFQLEFVRTTTGGLLAGYRFDQAVGDFHVLLSDPYSFPVDLLLEHLNADLPGTVVMGGLVGGAEGPTGSRLFRDREVVASGAVGVRLPGLRGVPIVSQGCRPIGYPYIVTGARGALITELGGRPPSERLREIVTVLPPDQLELLTHGLQIGIVVDEHLAAPGQGDFLIRGILGADPSSGAIEVGEVVEVGTTVQFQVRDAVGADKNLRAALVQASSDLPGRPAGALLFTCNGRGRRMFGVADHDAATIDDLLGGIPLAGFSAAGEIGPIAGRNELHGFTASIALFVE